MDASVSILGHPISKREYSVRQKGTVGFIANVAETIRDTLEALTSITMFDIDNMAVKALRNYDPIDSAKAAWTVFAWHRMINPYDHPDRKYKMDMERLKPIIQQDPESYYLYAVMVLKKPSQEVYDRLKTKHPKIAAQYLRYAKNYLIAEKKFGNLSWLYSWD